MDIILLQPDVSIDQEIGMIPHFLNEDDPRPAREQFNDHYAHGGGWQPMSNFRLQDNTLFYPGDPPLKPIAGFNFRDELILIYRLGIVATVQPDGSFEVARMD